MAGGNAKVSHSYNSVLYNCGALNCLRVPRKCHNVVSETAVNFLNYLINTRYAGVYQLNGPALKRLWHYGVIGISHSAGYNIPRLIPAVAALVKQKAHKLWY